MNKIFSRFMAFVFDYLLCTLLIILVASISFINPNYMVVQENYKDMSNEVVIYEEFKKYLEDVLKDAELSEEEFLTITKKYDSYAILFKDISFGEEITNKGKDELRNDMENRYIEVTNSYGYEINKLNVYQTVISVVVYMLYFGLFQFFMKGQTIGKKLFRLKVVNYDDKKSVPLWKYIVRSILITEIVFLLMDIILVFILKESSYLVSNYWLSNIKYIYEMLFIVVMIIRDDQRSVHDLICNTRVIKLDKKGNEVLDVLFKEEQSLKEDKKVVKKKEREVVEAIKVND